MPEKHSTATARKRELRGWHALVLLVLLSPLLIPLLAVLGAAWLAGAFALHLLTLILWLPSGRRVLFVYSNGPEWNRTTSVA